ncbi:hypothetical protein TCSYLVIO_008033 [Trypanosoma cruzi]|nr:hypothetical protein TCSYLVIO_008033 [Trypanosoma cruzi]
MCALEAERDLTDHFMNSGKVLLRKFRMQLMTASDSGVLLTKLRARHRTAVHEADTFARAAQPLVDRGETQRTLRFQPCRIYGHVTSTCNVRSAPRRIYSQYRRPSKKAKGLPAAYEDGRRQPPPVVPPLAIPHRQRTAPPMLHPIFQIARRNRREGRWSSSANDARLWYNELPTSPLWASYMRKANEVAREMCAPSTWERGMSLAGQFTTFCRTHERPTNAESCAAFLMAIEVAPSTRRQYARMLRSMLEMNRTPLDMMILGLQKIAAR